MQTGYCQTDSIGLGYARNSINGTIFRKNSIASYDGFQFASYYDSAGYVILAKRKIGTNTWETNRTQYTGDVSDAHRSISIAIDGDGYLHMSWDHHGNPLNYCISNAPFSITMGDTQYMTDSLEKIVTYPEFFRMPNGDLTFIYRDGWSGNANCVINKYNTKEKEWTRLHDNLISGEGARSAYWQSCIDTTGVIHVSWVWRESSDVSSNHDMCYAKSSDGGITWFNSKNEQYSLPITATTAEYIKRIDQNSNLMNQTSIYASNDSNVYICSYWTDTASNRPQYQLIYMNDDKMWQTLTLSDRVTTFSLAGWGTKKIPISRPQILIDDSEDKPVVYMIYRDEERGSKVSINMCKDIDVDSLEIQVYDITDFSVGDWEPSFDIDLWKESQQLDIFVQTMLQGDGETLSEQKPQPVYIWNVPLDSVTPTDMIYINK